MAKELLAKLNEDWKDYGLARPLDRFAAFIVDLVILFPIIQVIQAPFRHQLTHSIIHESAEDVGYWRITLFFVFSLCFILYHGICVGLYGQTLGRRFFGIRVIFLSGKNELVGGIARAIFVYFELLLLGFPMLAIFTNGWRRPIHDRIVDSLVVGESNKATFPTRFERTSAYMFTLSFAAFSSFMLVFLSWLATPTEPADEKTSIASMDSRCKTFEEIFGLNMNKAIEAFTNSELSADCLNTLASSALWKDQDKALANLANALAFYEDGQMSHYYMEEVCQQDKSGEPCQFVEWIMSDPMGHDVQKDKIISMLRNKELADFYKIYFIGVLHAHKDFETAEDVIKEIRRPDRFRSFLARTTFRNLLEQGRWDAAFWIYKSHQLGHEQLVNFVKKSVAQRRIPRRKIKKLIETFYPQLNVRDRSRGVASTAEAPAAIKMIWIRLGDGR